MVTRYKPAMYWEGLNQKKLILTKPLSLEYFSSSSALLDYFVYSSSLL